MKFYLFRCKARRQLLGATRYETGSNLPIEDCIGGWEFVELLHVTGPKLPKFSVDVTKLRRAVQQNGLYVWEEKSTPTGVAAMVAPPPPLATVAELPPVTMPVAMPVVPPPPVPVLRPLPTPVAPTPPLPMAPPPPRPPAPPVPAPVVQPAPPARAVPPPPARPAPAPAVAAETPPPPRPAAPPPRPAPPPPPPKPAPVAAPPPPRPAPPPTKRPAHQIVWFDIPVRDLERAVRFYSAVLGAPVEMVQAAFGTPTIALLPHPEGAITGSLVVTNDANVAEGGPLVYLSAQGRLDEAVAAAQMNGGKIVHAKQSFGSAGWRAIILDSEGNRIALHSA